MRCLLYISLRSPRLRKTGSATTATTRAASWHPFHNPATLHSQYPWRRARKPACSNDALTWRTKGDVSSTITTTLQPRRRAPHLHVSALTRYRSDEAQGLLVARPVRDVPWRLVIGAIRTDGAPAARVGDAADVLDDPPAPREQACATAARSSTHRPRRVARRRRRPYCGRGSTSGGLQAEPALSRLGAGRVRHPSEPASRPRLPTDRPVVSTSRSWLNGELTPRDVFNGSLATILLPTATLNKPSGPAQSSPSDQPFTQAAAGAHSGTAQHRMNDRGMDQDRPIRRRVNFWPDRHSFRSWLGSRTRREGRRSTADIIGRSSSARRGTAVR